MKVDRQMGLILRGSRFKALLEEELQEMRQKYRLRRTEIEVLYYLSQSGERNTSSDVQKELKLNKGLISQTIGSLCHYGYLTGITDTEDRRYIHYSLTIQADEVIEEIEEAWDKISRLVFEGIPEEQLQIYRDITEKIIDNMEKYLSH